MSNITLHCYVDQLLNNTDGKFDTFGSAWFTVPAEWLEEKVMNKFNQSLREFMNSYTYDNTDGLLQESIEEGVLLGCGTGDMTYY